MGIRMSKTTICASNAVVTGTGFAPVQSTQPLLYEMLMIRSLLR